MADVNALCGDINTMFQCGFSQAMGNDTIFIGLFLITIVAVFLYVARVPATAIIVIAVPFIFGLSFLGGVFTSLLYILILIGGLAFGYAILSFGKQQ